MRSLGVTEKTTRSRGSTKGRLVMPSPSAAMSHLVPGIGRMPRRDLVARKDEEHPEETMTTNFMKLGFMRHHKHDFSRRAEGFIMGTPRDSARELLGDERASGGY